MLATVKQSEKKRYDHYSRNPNRKQAEKRAKENLETMYSSFKSEGERKDYEYLVNSNPNNIKGLPTFFPPLEIISFGGIGEGIKGVVLPCGHTAISCRVNYTTHETEYICKYNHKHNDNNNN